MRWHYICSGKGTPRIVRLRHEGLAESAHEPQVVRLRAEASVRTADQQAYTFKPLLARVEGAGEDCQATESSVNVIHAQCTDQSLHRTWPFQQISPVIR